MYVAVMNIKSHKKLYKKGDILGNEFSENDIWRFLDMGAIFSRGEIPVFGIEDGYEPEESVFLDESALRKIKSKAELTEYGKSIGLDVPEEFTKEEMINALLNYIEEKRDNASGL